MIDLELISKCDEWLDANVGQCYKDQPLAQDLARVAKCGEECGEAIAEFIKWTGQNPRKGVSPEAYYDMLKELADVAITALAGIQHFTKNHETTGKIVERRIHQVLDRVGIDA